VAISSPVILHRKVLARQWRGGRIARAARSHTLSLLLRGKAERNLRSGRMTWDLRPSFDRAMRALQRSASLGVDDDLRGPTHSLPNAACSGSP
jgi:hypothetical protein